MIVEILEDESSQIQKETPREVLEGRSKPKPNNIFGYKKAVLTFDDDSKPKQVFLKPSIWNKNDNGEYTSIDEDERLTDEQKKEHEHRAIREIHSSRWAYRFSSFIGLKMPETFPVIKDGIYYHASEWVNGFDGRRTYYFSDSPDKLKEQKKFLGLLVLYNFITLNLGDNNQVLQTLEGDFYSHDTSISPEGFITFSNRSDNLNELFAKWPTMDLPYYFEAKKETSELQKLEISTNLEIKDMILNLNSLNKMQLDQVVFGATPTSIISLSERNQIVAKMMRRIRSLRGLINS